MKMQILRIFYVIVMAGFLSQGIYQGIIEPTLPQHSMGLIDIYELFIYVTASVAFGWLSTREK